MIHKQQTPELSNEEEAQLATFNQQVTVFFRRYQAFVQSVVTFSKL